MTKCSIISWIRFQENKKGISGKTSKNQNKVCSLNFKKKKDTVYQQPTDSWTVILMSTVDT